MTQQDETAKYDEVMPSQDHADKKEEEEETKVNELSIEQKLFHFCRSGDLEGIKSLLKENSDLKERINTKDPKHGREQGAYGGENTALHYACQYGHLEIVKFLFLQEADVEVRNKLGSTPLHIASANGRDDIVKFLIMKRCDTTAKNHIGNTPLHCSVYAGHVNTTKLLLENSDDKKHDLQDGNKVGMTPVRYCSHEEMKDYLRTIFRSNNNYETPKELRENELVDSNKTTKESIEDDGVEEIES